MSNYKIISINQEFIIIKSDNVLKDPCIVFNDDLDGKKGIGKFLGFDKYSNYEFQNPHGDIFSVDSHEIEHRYSFYEVIASTYKIDNLPLISNSKEDLLNLNKGIIPDDIFVNLEKESKCATKKCNTCKCQNDIKILNFI